MEALIIVILAIAIAALASGEERPSDTPPMIFLPVERPRPQGIGCSMIPFVLGALLMLMLLGGR